MKITQEKATFMIEVMSGIRRKVGVQKYHINKKGTARFNPEYKRLKSIMNKIEKFKSKEVEVKRISEL